MLGLFASISAFAAVSVVPEGSQKVCAGTSVPGYIKVNDEWNPTTCGNPSSIMYNVWTIARYDDKPVGSTMKVCTGPAPAGWAMIHSEWISTMCGYPSQIMYNVMTIKRLQ